MKKAPVAAVGGGTVDAVVTAVDPRNAARIVLGVSEQLTEGIVASIDDVAVAQIPTVSDLPGHSTCLATIPLVFATAPQYVPTVGFGLVPWSMLTLRIHQDTLQPHLLAA